ncbi:hypothetical protein BLNAU_5253 [Blattamonas nauphoetae]|uniref:Uncharacterized protein n=1 Tax=Blattamonas nauphoetae TaxID=2049346 RepID=A0ABQ9Y7V4_9EUKA|nr:hypothetical protein BLNAU_5253 [Blattamonas nauphoetae]
MPTGQEETEIRESVFSDCGTLWLENGGRKKGGVLIIELSSESRLDRQKVLVVDCIVMNSSPYRESDGEKMSGGVVVRNEGKGVVVVDIDGSWFEETEISKEVLKRTWMGIPIVSPNRKIVHSLLSDVPAGLVVGGGRNVPLILRRGSSFSGCSLRVETGEEETAIQTNSDEL